jgi:cytochrome c nitrite reductase small subunit
MKKIRHVFCSYSSAGANSKKEEVMGTRRIASGLLPGIALGIALIAFSAFAMRETDQRPFCASCHVMDTAAVTHKLSTHADQACNECHLPGRTADRLPFKAAEGLRDFTANVSGAEVGIPLNSRTRDVVNNNCRRCHAVTNTDVSVMEAKAYCVDCHRNIAHMRAKPVSTRMVAYE